MKTEGIEFLYELWNDMDWDTFEMSDLELVLAVIKKIEVKK